MRISPPPWLQDFTDEVCSCLRQLADADLGCHFHLVDGTWEVSLFFAATEYVGGELDGRRTFPTFWADLNQLMSVLEVEEMYWQANAVDEQDELGTHLAFRGNYQQHQVWLRLLAEAPHSLPSGQHIEAYRGGEVENW
ncbi:MAG: hypothetical protein KDA58_07130 [Planctomycetaceae bacterium]|nr:hypothetical protein [Planctomycetaceae bacterium]